MFRLSIGLAGLAIAAGLSTPAAQATPCAASDVSLTIGTATYAPSQCADNIAQGGGPLSETSALTSALAATATASPFVYLASSDQSSTASGIGGVTFTVTADDTNSGAWHVKWTDVFGLPNLPLLIDLEVGLFGGNNGAGYLLTNILLPILPNTGYGTFDVNFLNNGGHQPDLSHLILAGGNYSAAVPEPASLAVISIGMAALGLVRRRRAS